MSKTREEDSNEDQKNYGEEDKLGDRRGRAVKRVARKTEEVDGEEDQRSRWQRRPEK